MTRLTLPTTYDSCRLGYGCMRIAEDPERGRAAVLAAYEAGFRLFDHADIYGGGACEQLFGRLLCEVSGMRDSIVLQTKIGIRGDPARYDFAPDYLSEALDRSLDRLGVERVDLLLLHRIDLLADAAAVGAWLEAVHAAGKIAQAGVSNCSPSQLRMLQEHCSLPLAVNQIEINLDRIDAFVDGSLDQCQERGVRPQAWCPLAGVAYPAWGAQADPSRWPPIHAELERHAEVYQLAPADVVIAWLLRHPARIMPLIGSTTPARIASALAALDCSYEHVDWYRLLEARRGVPMP